MGAYSQKKEAAVKGRLPAAYLPKAAVVLRLAVIVTVHWGALPVHAPPWRMQRHSPA